VAKRIQGAAAIAAFADVGVEKKLAAGVERTGERGGHETGEARAIADGGAGRGVIRLRRREQTLADAPGGLIDLGGRGFLRANFR
jgi:hypothetical protein